MLAEIEEMRKIGGDFLYFSDGWQKGAAMTPLSKERYTGQWGKPGYWETDRDKFPDGLGPVVRKADGYGMKKGIWFCPDKTDEYENYEKDIDVLLNLYREYGFDKVKFDAITFRTKRAEKRIKKVMEALVEESEGKAFVEIDITAGIRTDYFDAMQYGFLFLENRYTDFRRYYPHCTLRNLWMLSHYVDPRRLRIELLNNERNSHLYENDPLAPDKYKADFLYVGTIFANPLFWFEVTGLSDSYKKLLKETVELCRPVRKELARSFVYPIGEEPDGFTICGFISVNGDCGYAAFFRCAGEEEAIDTEVPLVQGEYLFELMAGSGSDFKTEVNGKMQIGVPEKHSFGLYRYKRLE
jgi:alpha-galactosidase